MADSSIPITAGAGTNVDTRTESINGDHRQVVVLGDPVTGANVALVNAGGELAHYAPDTLASGNITTPDAVVAAPGGAGAFVTGASTAGSLIALALNGGENTAMVQLTGTFTGTTLYFEGSMDSTNGTDGNWMSLNASRTGLISISTGFSATTAGMWRVSVGGLKYIRVRAVAGTLTVAVLIRASESGTAAFLDASLPAGGSLIGGVNVAQINAVTVLTGNGNTGTGAQRVVLSNDGTSTANPFIPAVTTTGDTGAKTTTFNGATQTQSNFRGAVVVINMGAVTGTTPTCVAKIQCSADGGTTWYDLPGATTASLVATGVFGITVYPGVAVTAGTTTSGSMAQASAPLPKTWRVVYTISGTTPSFTLTNVQVSFLV